MAEADIIGRVNALGQIMNAPDLAPGDQVSYQTCKLLYVYHPLGAKVIDTPLALAQSQERTISVPKGPEDRLREAFLAEWKAIEADKHIFNLGRLARVYG